MKFKRQLLLKAIIKMFLSRLTIKYFTYKKYILICKIIVLYRN